MVKNSEQLDDHVSSAKAAEIFDNQLKHEQTRQHIISIVNEYVDSVPFMEKVRKYSGMEIDSRLFVSGKYWMLTVASAAVAALIGLIANHFTHWLG
jgi:hypothetical protein